MRLFESALELFISAAEPFVEAKAAADVGHMALANTSEFPNPNNIDPVNGYDTLIDELLGGRDPRLQRLLYDRVQNPEDIPPALATLALYFEQDQ